MDRPTVSVIIPSRGRPSTLASCLASLKEQAGRMEILVAGDFDDEPTRLVAARFKGWVKYVESPAASRAAARNFAVEKAAGDVVAFLDDDVTVVGDWSEHLLRHFEDPTVGGVGGKVVLVGRSGVQVSGLKFPTGSILNGFVVGNWNGDVNDPVEVEHLPGCNMAFRRALVLSVRGFDRRFRDFNNFREETDLAIKIRRAGYRLIFDPKVAVSHLALGADKMGLGWMYYYVRNSTLLFLRYWKDGTVGTAVLFLKNLLFPPTEYVASSPGRFSRNIGLLVIVPLALVDSIASYLSKRRHGAGE